MQAESIGSGNFIKAQGEGFLRADFFVAQTVQAQVNDRASLLPVPVVFYPQAPKQLLLPLKQGGEGRDQQALAKPARTRQEVACPFGY